MVKEVKNEEQIEVNFDAWSYREISEYYNAYNRADISKMNALLTNALGTELNTLDIAASTKLKYDVLIKLNDYIEGIDYSDVKVDFKRAKWTDIEFEQYRKASGRGDTAEVERLLKEVCILEGVEPHAALNARQGSKMAQAIVKAYRDMLTGKF